MDSVLNTLLQFGIGGTMAFAVLWFLHYLVKVTIPTLIQSFVQVMQDERKSHSDITDKIVGRLEKMDTTLDKVQENLVVLAGKSDQVTRHIKANEEHNAVLRDFIVNKLPKDAKAV